MHRHVRPLAVQFSLVIGLVAGAQEISGLDRLDFRDVIKDSKERVFPAVVYVKCVRESHASGRRRSEEVSGSGVLISPDGELLTNWHVVDKAVELRCLLYDGRAYDAVLVGADKDLDLALVKLNLGNDPSALPYAELGESSRLNEGDFVMAMGAPWGLSRSVSIGIISCRRRYLPQRSEYSLWLQTDAAISPGNSGGPLVSTGGRVVGINTLGMMQGGNTGFSIPSDVIRDVVPRLRQYGDIQWAWTGLQLQALRDFNRNIYFQGTEGVIVAGTDPESPARRAGIQNRDRILTIGGQPANAITEEDLPDLRRRIALLPTDKAVAIELLRGEEKVAVNLTPRRKGKVEGEALDCPRWDLTLRVINQFGNPDVYFYRKQGVFVYGVKFPGNAALSGFRSQDIILKIDGKDVSTLEDIEAIHKSAMDNVESKPRMLFTLLRNGLMRQVILDFSREYK